MKRAKMPPPDWSEWSQAANLSVEEAVALTMNFCPIMFGIVASESGVEFGDATEFEKRLRMLKRSCETRLATADLAKIAKRFDWEEIPAELANLGTPTLPEPATEPSDEEMSENERTKLLKQIGGLALLLAEKSNVFTRGTHPNASQIAHAVVAHIEGLPGHDGAGYSSLRASIKAGVDLLKK